MELTLEEFVSRYSDYARVIACKFVNEVSDYGIDFEDLYQTGCLALVECYHRYDSKKASYSTFAYNSIYYAILDYINDNCYLTHVSDDVNYLARYLRKKQMQFYFEHGKNMPFDESLEVLNKALYTYNLVINKKFVLMLEKISMFQYRKQFYYSSDGIEIYDLYNGEIEDEILFDELVVSEENVEDIVVKNVLISEIREYLDKLPDGVRKNIFIDLVGLNDGTWKTLREVSLKYDISHQAVSNNYKKVLKKIQTEF